jgi:hypothetical protein
MVSQYSKYQLSKGMLEIQKGLSCLKFLRPDTAESIGLLPAVLKPGNIFSSNDQLYRRLRKSYRDAGNRPMNVE